VNALAKALIPVAEVLDEGGHGPLLAARAWKVVREAAAGEARRELRQVASCSADRNDPGTYESVAV